MVSINVVFWMFVILFALIGGMRGWAREILVAFAVILGIFIISVLEIFVPFIRDTLPQSSPAALFWLRIIIILGRVFFGYQTPTLPKIAQTGRFARERLQDILLGFFIGAINGYLVWGTIWFYMAQANYPFGIISPPDGNTAMGDAALRLLTMMPPHFLTTPAIYFAVAVAFVFVMVVFI